MNHSSFSYQRTGSLAGSPEEKGMVYHLGAITGKWFNQSICKSVNPLSFRA
ncbi:MAG TPA: hypothetical protein VJ824_04975 [Bacillota bacterium]|nr:hypothetical protein [Bacillota bacterium]